MLNLLDKYKPIFAPEVEAGVDIGADAGPPPGEGSGGGGAPSADDAPQKLTIRQSLEKGFEDARKAERPRLKTPAAEKPKRAADQMREEAETDTANEETGAAPHTEEAGEPAAQVAASEPPAAWAKEAKAEWAKLPKVAQDAILKREQDVQRGVDELKSKYADIDASLQPHLPVIRQHGHTPAQAVNQLFGWFQALGANPDQAFPALIQSFGWDPRRVYPPQMQQPQQQTAPQQQQQPNAQPPQGTPQQQQQPVQLPPEVVQYLQRMNQEIVNLRSSQTQQQQTYQQQQYKATEASMYAWAKDKPHFEKVRQQMAQLVGAGLVPMKDDRIDLDAAYQMAVRMDGELFAQEQQAAQEKLQADVAAKAKAAKEAQDKAAAAARKAAVSVTPASPGTNPGTRGTPQKGKKMTVRESLLAAIEENRV